MARILITGAAGFIGAGLCPMLAERGHEVVAGLRRARAAPAGAEPLVLGEIGPADQLDGGAARRRHYRPSRAARAYRTRRETARSGA